MKLVHEAKSVKELYELFMAIMEEKSRNWMSSESSTLEEWKIAMADASRVQNSALKRLMELTLEGSILAPNNIRGEYPMKTAPTIGRVVWYNAPELSNQMCSAQVVYVHSEDCVNLAVFDSQGSLYEKTSVSFYHGDGDIPTGMCGWMPFQAKQHAKYAKENAENAAATGVGATTPA